MIEESLKQANKDLETYSKRVEQAEQNAQKALLNIADEKTRNKMTDLMNRAKSGKLSVEQLMKEAWQ